MTAEKFVGLVIENKARVKEYYLGGDGSGGKCDCIGLIIGALRMGGIRWTETHGSNYAARYEMRSFNKIGSKDDLRLGHLVYKSKAPGKSGWSLPSRYLTHADTNDYYHVGVVTSVNPLEITHCTSVEGGIKVDSAVGKWTHYGEIKAVKYDVDEEQPTMSAYRVTGGKLALRKAASTNGALIVYMEDGTEVEASPRSDGWSNVRYNGKTGYSMTQYLRPVSSVPTLEERVAALEAWRDSVMKGG